jgi:U3 small nucleolar RNA-associated protein 7
MKAQAKRIGPYMTNPFPSQPVHDVSFCPFEDVLGVGHSAGLSSLLIPGAGEPNYDAFEADPFESKRARQEREVHGLLDKIQPDQITMDRDLIGKVQRPQKDGAVSAAAGGPKPKGIGPRQSIIPHSKLSRAQRLEEAAGSAEDGSEAEGDKEGVEQRGHKQLRRKRVVGKNKVRRRLLRVKADIIDAKTMARREKIADNKKRAAERAQAQPVERPSGALARFG